MAGRRKHEVSGGVGTRSPVGITPGVLLDLQKAAGNRAVSAMVARAPQAPRVTTEDVKGIVDGHLAMWYSSMRAGVLAAHLGDQEDEWGGWFYVALAGNMLWAATAFLGPETKAAEKTMSLVGAFVGSGGVEHALSDKADASSDVEALKQSVVSKLSEQYTSMQGDAALTERVEMELGRRGLMNGANDAAQAQERRRAAWGVMFRDRIKFQDPFSIESESRRTIEAIWREFQPMMRDLVRPAADNFMTQAYPYKSPEHYAAVAFKTALVRSGVLIGVPGYGASYAVRRTPDHPRDDLYATYTLPDGDQVDVDVKDIYRPMVPDHRLRIEHGRAGEDWSPFRQSYEAEGRRIKTPVSLTR
jgi:hypothetical protein